MSRILLAQAACLVAFTVAVPAQTRLGKVHRLEATPATVAYGYYWSEAKPALRIASGDVIDVDTLLANNPTGLQRAGVPEEKIQESLKAIVAEVTGDKKGPGGHILTGPVYVEGAEPGDALEVKVLSIVLTIDYGYNGCAGFLRENCDRAVGTKIIRLDKKTMTATFARRDKVSTVSSTASARGRSHSQPWSSISRYAIRGPSLSLEKHAVSRGPWRPL